MTFNYTVVQKSLEVINCVLNLALNPVSILTHMVLFLHVCRLNDIIVSVNRIATENVTHAQAVETLKRAGRSVVLVSVLHPVCVIIYIFFGCC